MNIRDFVSDIDVSEIIDTSTLFKDQWGHIITQYKGDQSKLDAADLVLLGVPENRGTLLNADSSLAPETIRREIYRLFQNYYKVQICDAGDLNIGETARDTYFALANVIMQLVGAGKTVIILGGSHDLTYGQYLGYQELYEMVNMVVVDELIDLNKMANGEVLSNSFLLPIFMHQPNYLFNYTHLGYQSYYNDAEAIGMLEDLNFECHRLGKIRGHLEEVEPMIRNADMVSVDISAIKASDAPGHEFPTPNGFYGEEVCKIMRYAGYSERLSSIGFYEYNPRYDNRFVSAKLIAQMIWYFVEGFCNRRNDQPTEENSNNYLKYIVEFKDQDHELIFWKSKLTDRWWMELPFGDKEAYKRQQLVPCSYADYQLACKEELPDRWMKAFHKLV